VWYGKRGWIEQGFKDDKRGGWQWHQTQMTDPTWAERLWLAIAVATVWVVSVGGEADASLPARMLEALPARHIAWRTRQSLTRPRLLRCFARRLLTIIGTLIREGCVVLGRFVPESWLSVVPPTEQASTTHAARSQHTT
jgi:hypothetical protein